MKFYVVVYLSDGGIHYRFRCSAQNKREAKRMCKEYLGIEQSDITDCYEEE